MSPRQHVGEMPCRRQGIEGCQKMLVCTTELPMSSMGFFARALCRRLTDASFDKHSWRTRRKNAGNCSGSDSNASQPGACSRSFSFTMSTIERTCSADDVAASNAGHRYCSRYCENSRVPTCDVCALQTRFRVRVHVWSRLQSLHRRRCEVCRESTYYNDSATVRF